MNLDRYLKDKPLYYKEIDYLRMPRAYESIRDYLKIPKVIHVVGTNGKGSTGRFIAEMLLNQNFHVGHYTSPHIFNFNERIWVDGKDVSDEILDTAHDRLQTILSDEFKKSLSYFEYTTFLAMLIFSQRCDYVVLEAGLGGEFDATGVFSKVLSVITPIGYDHSSFLGKTIEEIATTKINSIEKLVLLSKQYEEEVYEVATEVVSKKGSTLFLAEEMPCSVQKSQIDNFVLKNSLPNFQGLNLQTAICALKVLGFSTNLNVLTFSTMPGRCQKISKHITIDVGHNIMAAQALEKHFRGKKVTIIYNSFKDKEYGKILDILSPIISNIEIIQLENDRGLATQDIIDICKQKNIECDFLKRVEKDKEYLVFGSFLVVEKFLKEYFEK